MSRSKPEPVQIIKERRDKALRVLIGGIPYVQFLGIRFDRRGDELTAVLPFDEKLIGNPFLPALHGGVTAAFLEVTAMIELSWSILWEQMEQGTLDPRALDEAHAYAFENTQGLRVALDQELSEFSAPLAGVREVAFFPPMTGG